MPILKTKNELKVKGACAERKELTLCPHTSYAIADFAEDGKAIAQFLFENLPAITLSFVMRELMNRSVTK